MYIEEELKKYYNIIKKKVLSVKKRTLYCIGVGCILAVFSFLINEESIYIKPYEIKRSSYGTPKTPYHINLD